MFVRQLYISVSPEQVHDLKRLYHEEIIPAVKYLKGYVECDLLEPVNAGDEFIGLSIWKRQSDALAYESSELYSKLRNEVVRLAKKVPVLKTYTFEPVGKESLVY